MQKKAIIFDLDNTIYSVHSIGNELFASLFDLILQQGNYDGQMEQIKEEIMRKPFQVVAAQYSFGKELTQQGIALLKNQTYQGKIKPFPDYAFVRQLPVDKFLVTTGFLKLQQSKVEGMNLAPDFKEIHIVDPSISDKIKKEVFADIIKRHKYSPKDLLVVGDDPHSEIKAAQELGIDPVLYDRVGFHEKSSLLAKISDFRQLNAFIK